MIYELHVKGFTQLHPAVPEKWRGNYLGLTVAPVIEHLKSIGVTAVELLPCQSFVSEQFLLERNLATTGVTTPSRGSRPRTNTPWTMPWSSSRPMVKALHAAGIEVILDVVFNHTAEGNESGPLLVAAGHRQFGVLPC